MSMETTAPSARMAGEDADLGSGWLLIAGYVLAFAAYGYLFHVVFSRDFLDESPALQMALMASIGLATITHAAAWRPGANLKALALAAGLAAIGGAIAYWRISIETDAPAAVLSGGLQLGRLIAATALGGLLLLIPLARIANGAAEPVAATGGYPAELCRIWLTVLVSLFIAGLGFAVALLIANLFNMIGFKLLLQLIERGEYWTPLFGGLFGAALATLVLAPARMRALANLFFLLTGWLAFPATIAAFGFVAVLPFTGLEPLWATRSATLILFGISFTLMCVLGATFARPTGGRIGGLAVAVARVGGLASVVLVALALWAIHLRVEQYGLTPDRVVSLLFGIGFGLFALAYAAALLRPEPGIRPALARFSKAAALATAVAAMAIALPPLDAARLSAASQIERLRAGTSQLGEDTARHFVRTLGAYGRAGAEALKAEPGKLDRAQFVTAVEAALTARPDYPSREDRPSLEVFRAGFGEFFVVAPAGQAVPADLIDWAQDHFEVQHCIRAADPAKRTCILLKADLRSDGVENWVFIARTPRNGSGRLQTKALRVVERQSMGGWFGRWLPSGISARGLSDAQWDAIGRGEVRFVDARWRELHIDGQVLVPVEPGYR